MIKNYSLQDTLTFGKHKGKSLREIAENDPFYIMWMIETIPAFFILPEDLLNLMLCNQEIILFEDLKAVYLKKRAMFEMQYFRQAEQLDTSLWSSLKTTRRNAIKVKAIESRMSSYQQSEPFTLLIEGNTDVIWEACRQGVDLNGIPKITVYADLSESLRNKKDSEAAFMASEGLLSMQFSPFIKVEVNMDHPAFGCVAKKLVDMGLLKVKSRTEPAS